MNKLRSAVRPVVTFALVGALIYGFVVDKVDPKVFTGIVAGTLAWWFYDRYKKAGNGAT